MSKIIIAIFIILGIIDLLLWIPIMINSSRLSREEERNEFKNKKGE